jgi:hypothetical protein
MISGRIDLKSSFSNSNVQRPIQALGRIDPKPSGSSGLALTLGPASLHHHGRACSTSAKFIKLSCGGLVTDLSQIVMTGLGSVIHVLQRQASKTWMPGSSSGMTTKGKKTLESAP